MTSLIVLIHLLTPNPAPAAVIIPTGRSIIIIPSPPPSIPFSSPPYESYSVPYSRGPSYSQQPLPPDVVALKDLCDQFEKATGKAVKYDRSLAIDSQTRVLRVLLDMIADPTTKQKVTWKAFTHITFGVQYHFRPPFNSTSMFYSWLNAPVLEAQEDGAVYADLNFALPSSNQARDFFLQLPNAGDDANVRRRALMDQIYSAREGILATLKVRNVQPPARLGCLYWEDLRTCLVGMRTLNGIASVLPTLNNIDITSASPTSLSPHAELTVNPNSTADDLLRFLQVGRYKP